MDGGPRVMVEAPQYDARGLFETVEVAGEPIEVPALVPKPGNTPGATRWTGSGIGAHSREVHAGAPGLGEDDLRSPGSGGII